MEVNKIDGTSITGEVKRTKEKPAGTKCIFYPAELCFSPKSRFKICQKCYRIDIKFAAANLFAKIKSMALALLKLQVKPPAPPLPKQ